MAEAMDCPRQALLSGVVLSWETVPGGAFIRWGCRCVRGEGLPTQCQCDWSSCHGRELGSNDDSFKSLPCPSMISSPHWQPATSLLSVSVSVLFYCFFSVFLRCHIQKGNSVCLFLNNTLQICPQFCKWQNFILFLWLIFPQGFPGGSEVKASASNAGDPGSIPGLGRSPGERNGNPLQYSCLENPMDREAW